MYQLRCVINSFSKTLVTNFILSQKSQSLQGVIPQSIYHYLLVPSVASAKRYWSLRAHKSTPHTSMHTEQLIINIQCISWIMLIRCSRRMKIPKSYESSLFPCNPVWGENPQLCNTKIRTFHCEIIFNTR